MSIRKTYDELKFTVDFMFCKILTFGLELCRKVLQLIMGREKEIFDSVNEGDYSLERGAQKLGISLSDFLEKMRNAGYIVSESI